MNVKVTSSNISKGAYQYELSLLKSLDTAISSEAMLEILRRDWSYLKKTDWDLKDCRAIRVYPRKGEDFLIEYEMRFFKGGSERVEQFFGELVGEKAVKRCDDLLVQLKKTRRKQVSRTRSTDGICCLPDLGLILRFSGIDEKIHGMKLINKPAMFKPILEKCLQYNSERISGCSIEVLRHRLGKRFIFRLRFDARDEKTGKRIPQSVIGKMYPAKRDRGGAVFTAMENLWEHGFSDKSEDGIRIPRPIAYLPELQLLLMEDVPGSYWVGLQREGVESSIKAAGKALSKLHRSSLKVPGRHTVEDELTLLRDHWIVVASQIHPELSASLKAAFSKVHRALDKCRGFEPCLVHRDYYEKQVLVDRSQAFMIDFDTICLSDPAIDIGNFRAHIKLAEMQSLGSAKRMEEIFLKSYAPQLSGDFSARIEAYTQSALLRLSCLYSIWPQWRHLAEPLLKDVI